MPGAADAPAPLISRTRTGTIGSMHIPGHFRQDDTEAMKALILANPLGTLVTLGPGGLSATHIPFELASKPSPHGSLLGHVARVNPLWREVSPDVEALVIFHGANSYVSPSWYPSKQLNPKVVPTWNYVVVHAYGRVRAVEDAAWLRAHVESLSNRQEANFDQPWSVADAPNEFIEKMLGAIVGIEIEVSRLEGNWKVSQNRPAADRQGVVNELRKKDAPQAREMADHIDNAKR